MNRFTQYPWIAIRNEGSFFRWEGTEGTYSIKSGDEYSEYMLSTIWVRPDGREGANARLMAAAPELLEALQETVDGLGEFWRILPAETQEKIKTALAKVTGGAK